MSHPPELNTRTITYLAKKRLIRGTIAISASILIAIIIRTGIAEPHPNLKIAYIGCIVVGTWGLIDIFRSIFRTTIN